MNSQDMQNTSLDVCLSPGRRTPESTGRGLRIVLHSSTPSDHGRIARADLKMCDRVADLPRQWNLEPN
jgi:hypothetical protein